MNILNYLIVLALLIWTAYSLWKIIDVKHRRAASSSCPLVIGSVTGKQVDIQSGPKGGKSFVPKVTYMYSILGSVVTKTVTMESKSQKSDAEQILSQVGYTVHARYNPQKPTEHISELEQVTLSNIFTLMIAILFLITSLMPLLFNALTSSTSTR